jgi:hypothetical protein
MSYRYESEREKLFTDEGQRLFLGVRDRVNRLLNLTGAIRMGEAAKLPDGIGAASSWQMLACVDRMLEIGELREVGLLALTGQDRIFVRPSQ